MKIKKIGIPLDEDIIRELKVGEEIFLSGTIYTARDQAHRRLVAAIRKGKQLPFDLKGVVIYYCGPTKTPPGKVIGSCGPTTSLRMAEFTPILLQAGLKAVIGKGRCPAQVVEAIKKYKGVYFLTYAGCGALLSKYVQRAKPIAYRKLGPEAIYALEVRDFPLIVGADCYGGNIYQKEKD